jgi:hypothetical protein
VDGLPGIAARRGYVLMIRLPAGRLRTGPLPPLLFAARRFAAVMRPPLLFFAMGTFLLGFVDVTSV